MIIFARTRYHYDSYTDFWKLVELSGYPIVYVDEIEINNPDNTYIFSPMNGEFQSLIPKTWVPKNHRCTVFHWNLERPGGSGTIAFYKETNQQYIDRGWIDAVLVSDMQLAVTTGFKYVPLGSHVGLGEYSANHEKIYDVTHLSCYSPRRGFLFDYPHPKTKLGDMTIGPNCWGSERHEVLKRTKYMLNIHQDDFMYMEPLRFALAAAYGLPIITEQCDNIYPYNTLAIEINKQLIRDLSVPKAVKHIIETFLPDYQQLAQQIHYRLTIENNFKSLLEKHL